MDRITRLFALSLACMPVQGQTLSEVYFQSGASVDQKMLELQNLGDESTPSSAMPLALLAAAVFNGQDTEALYELAYAAKGFSQLMPADKHLAVCLLADRVEKGDKFAVALEACIKKRSLSKAKRLLKLASSPRQRALAFMCLAEVHFARQQKPKALLYSVLSLATYPSEIHNKQAQFYVRSLTGESISLLQSRDDLMAQLNESMEKTRSPETFRLLFDIASVVGLLSSYPLDFSSKILQAEPCEIFLGFDDGYAKHGGTTILSTILSAKPTSRYAFKVIEDEATPISEKNKNRLRDLVTLFGDGRFTLEFVPVQAQMLPPLLATFDPGFWPRIVFYKLLIPQLSDGQPRSLWLDSDVIVRSDLNPLYNWDFKGAWFLGTRDVGGCGYLNNIRREHTDKYLNVGVLLMNNQAIIKGKGLDVLATVLEEDPDFTDRLYLPEQDIIASLYQDYIREIGQQKVIKKNDDRPCAEWNWFAQNHPSTVWSRVHDHYSNIIHMEGGIIKPWHKGQRFIRWIRDPKRNNGIINLYWALRDMGPWPVSERVPS